MHLIDLDKPLPRFTLELVNINLEKHKIIIHNLLIISMDNRSRFSSDYCKELLNHRSKRNSNTGPECLTTAFGTEDLSRLDLTDQETVLDIVRVASEDRSDLEVEDNIRISKVLSSDDFLLPSLAKVKANPFSLKKEDFSQQNYHQTTGCKYLRSFERAHQEIKTACITAQKEVEESRLLDLFQKQVEEAIENTKPSSLFDTTGTMTNKSRKRNNKQQGKAKAEEDNPPVEESVPDIPPTEPEEEDWEQQAAEIQREAERLLLVAKEDQQKMGDISDKQSPEASSHGSRPNSPLSEIMTMTATMTKMTFENDPASNIKSPLSKNIPDIPPDESDCEEDHGNIASLPFLATGVRWKPEEIIDFGARGRDFLKEGSASEQEGAWGGTSDQDLNYQISAMSSTYLELPEDESKQELDTVATHQLIPAEQFDDLLDDPSLRTEEGEKLSKSKKKETKNDKLIAEYNSAKELFDPMKVSHWDNPSLLPVLLQHSKILGITPMECLIQVNRIKAEDENRTTLSYIISHLIELKDRIMDIEERVSAMGEGLKQKPQQVDDVIHPIRELVVQVADIKRANTAVVSGVSTLQQMLRTPRNLACILPEANPSLPYEPLIQEDITIKKRTVGRKPIDRPEEREDLSKPSKRLTKLERLRLNKNKDQQLSRDTSPSSGKESEKSCFSSISGAKKKVMTIPDYSPAQSDHKLEAIPKHPLQHITVNTVKPNKDIFKSSHFLKLAQAGIPIQSIEKYKSLLPNISVKSLDTLIKWLKDNSKGDWDSIREKMIESFSKRTGDELKAISLYHTATLSEDSEVALQYLIALREAKLALGN